MPESTGKGCPKQELRMRKLTEQERSSFKEEWERIHSSMQPEYETWNISAGRDTVHVRQTPEVIHREVSTGGGGSES